MVDFRKKKTDCIPLAGERLKKAVGLWKEGYSGEQIAARVGSTTRCAVIAKMHRDGHSDRSKIRSPNAHNTVRTHKPKSRPPKPFSIKYEPHVDSGLSIGRPEKFTPTPETIDVPHEERVGVADLTSEQCRWPIGDPGEPDFHFCNQEQIPGASYCEHHYRIAHESVEVRKRRKRKRKGARKLEVVHG